MRNLNCYFREGNTLQTVHLWQPSGNRSNRPKINGEGNKKSQAKPKKARKTIHRIRKKKSIKKKPDLEENILVSDPVPQESNLQEKIDSIEPTVDQPSLDPPFEPTLPYPSELEREF